MRLGVIFTEEIDVFKRFIFDTVSSSLIEIAQDDLQLEPVVANIIYFHSKDLVVFPIELPPGLAKNQRRLVAKNSLEDEPVFDSETYVISDPPESAHGEVGVGIARAEYIESLRKFDEKFLLSAQPFEVLLASVLGSGVWLVRFHDFFRFMRVTENGLVESYSFDIPELDEIRMLLESRQISFNELTLDEEIFRRCVEYVRSNRLGQDRGAIEFASENQTTRLLEAFWKASQPIRKVASLLVVLLLAVWTFVFFYRAVGYGIMKYYVNALMDVDSSQEAEVKIAQLRQDLTKLEQDINQLSALTYPNVFNILAALSKTLSTPLDSIEFAPPKIIISGVANEYAPIENLKKELIKDRELFCSVKLENLRDFRNQKKFTFEISMCRA